MILPTNSIKYYYLHFISEDEETKTQRGKSWAKSHLADSIEGRRVNMSIVFPGPGMWVLVSYAPWFQEWHVYLFISQVKEKMYLRRNFLSKNILRKNYLSVSRGVKLFGESQLLRAQGREAVEHKQAGEVLNSVTPVNTGLNQALLYPVY